MVDKALVVVAGLGEVGRPLLHILSQNFDCAGIDIEPVTIESPCLVLHICYPFEIDRFVDVTAEYVRRLHPALTILHSSVPPGTTKKVQEEIGNARLAYSPVRGNHPRMESDLMRYRKFVAATCQESLQAAMQHLSRAGFHTTAFPTVELAELAKLLETSYLGVLMAWAQDMKRIAAQYGGDFNDLNGFFEELEFLPSHIYLEGIGEHKVLPDIALLRSCLKSQFLDLAKGSNRLNLKRPTSFAGEFAKHLSRSSHL
jgi:UDP-N-acetyl-D-mannosaminuronate dehydrogenase